MTARAALVFLALSVASARAEPPLPPDDLSKAYDAALAELCAGKDRQSIADRLKPAVEKNPASNYAPVASAFGRSVAEAIGRIDADGIAADLAA